MKKNFGGQESSFQFASKQEHSLFNILRIILVSSLGMGFLLSQAWVSFVMAHTVDTFLAYTFPFEPFILSLLGQTIAFLLANNKVVRCFLMTLLSRPVLLTAYGIVCGVFGMSAFLAQSYWLFDFSSFASGFLGTILVIMWGLFFCDQQPRYAAISIAASFLISCFVALLVEPLGLFGVVTAIGILPILSTILWLACARFENSKGSLSAGIRARLSGLFLENGIFGKGSLRIFKHNSTLLTFAICSFVIYLMEQFVFSGENNPPGFMTYSIIVALVVVLIFCLYGTLGKKKDPDTLWPLFVLAIFGALLTIPFLWSSNSDIASNISVVASRSLTIFTWIVVVTTIGRFSLEPLRAFCLGMILTSIVPWMAAFALSSFLHSYLPSVLNHVGVLALVLAFLLAGTIILHFMRMNSRSLDQMHSLLAFSDQREEAQTGPKLKESSPFSSAAALSDLEQVSVIDSMHDPYYDQVLEQVSNDFMLTARESEITGMILQGYTLPEVAETLVLSMNTVRSHYSHAYQKLHVHKKAELRRLFEEYLLH